MVSADALRYFLQVARRGRLVSAASALGVDHTTVGRQISRLERDLGYRLFDRSPTGWVLSDAGQRLLPHAEAVDAAVLAATADDHETGQLSGTVRIATPDAFGAFILAPGLGTFREEHPNVDVHIVTSTRNVALSMREFDIAVTLQEPQPRHAIYRRLTDYTLRLYATPEYLAERPPIRDRTDLRDHTLIWYVDDLLDITPLRLPDDILPGHRVSIQTNNVTGHWQAAVAGLGLAPLPRYLGDQDQRLVPVLADTLQIRRTYWLAIPRESARLGRVRALAALLEQIVSDRQDDLFGDARNHHES
ncbi:LysR family transcriptional regulator [Saccharopolyspora sp. NPDC049426]|uniref:LysR family transcriptional regulator n=1 Tax=Saccharopolyspora sp. NPDC049426 TaxID=3155652 RepID=UPI003424914A